MSRALRAASFRHLLQHPAQLALALLGLTVGVATITAVDLATEGARRSFSLSIDAVNGTVTHQLVGGPGGIPETLFTQLALAPDLPPVAPVVEGYVTIGEQSFDLLGIDVFSERSGSRERLRRGTLDLLRQFVAEPGTIVLSPGAAKGLGARVGEHVTLEAGGRRYDARLIALTDEDQPGLDTVVLTDIAQAQEWFGIAGRLTRIDVWADTAARGKEQVAALQRRLPADVDLVAARRSARENLDMTAAFMTNLRAMSLLALLVSVFLIYSAISFAVVQRRSTLATLRALGVTRAQVLRLILAEAAVLGIVGAAAGVIIGGWLGHALLLLVSRTVNDLYFVTAMGSVHTSTLDLAMAIGAGVGASLVAALIPALEAASGAPLPGLRRSVLERRAGSLSRWLLAVAALLASGSLATVLLSERSVYAGFAALLLLLLSVAAATPAALAALAGLLGRTFRGRAPFVRLAVHTVSASLSRTGVAIAALAVAVAAMLGVTIMVGSFRESLADWLERTLSADIYVSAPGLGFGRPERRLDPDVIRDLLLLPGISDHAATRRVRLQSDHGTIALEALELAGSGHRGIDLLGGNREAVWDAFRRGELIVSQPFSYRHSVKPGDALTLRTDTGPRSFRIAGLYRDYGNDRGTVLIDRAIYRDHWHDEGLSALGLYLAPGLTTETAMPRVRAAVAGRQALFIRSNADLRALSLQIFDRTFAITHVLEWLAAGVAVMGLLSALLAWELERVREIAVLRALGLSAGGTARMIMLQTFFMGCCALVAALPAGFLTAWVLIEAINQRAFGWQIDLHLHATQLTAAALLAIGASLAAGVYPAWRGARAPIAAGMREE